MDAASDPDQRPPGTLGELIELGRQTEAAIGRLLDHTDISYFDINAGDPHVVILGDNPNRWSELDGAGQRALGEAREIADVWGQHVTRAVEVGARERLDAFEGLETDIDQVLRRENTMLWTQGAPASSIQEVRDQVAKTIAEAETLLRELPSANGAGGRLLVPDTNALIYAPAVENWRLPATGTLVFVPQVVRELDEKKMHPRIGQKATSVINRLKEYGRRGDTFRGVPLREGLTVREVAVDADVSASLDWLRAEHADDQLLASVLQLKWVDLRSDVWLVTRDRNMQNKARFARTRCLDVEELAPAG